MSKRKNYPCAICDSHTVRELESLKEKFKGQGTKRKTQLFIQKFSFRLNNFSSQLNVYVQDLCDSQLILYV